MRRIEITDITLREAATDRGMSLSFKETIETAKILDRLCVDTIALAPVVNEKIDSLLVRTISTAVKKSRISVPVGATKESVETAWKALSGAKKARLSVELPVSPVQMEYMCGAKPSVILGLAGSLVAEAKRYCSDVEFVAKDATRGDDGFLSQVVAAALENGATTITLCDTAGTMLPHEFESFVEKLYSEVPALSGAELCVMVSDELSLALASSLSAVTKGASGICVSVNGSAAPSLEAAAHIFRMRGEECSCGLKTTELNRAVKQINWMTRSKKEKNSPFSTGIFTDKESNVKFDKADSITEISEACRKLGYDLSEDDTAKVFKTFRELAEKKTVGVKELEAIIASTAMQVPPAYELVSFVINSGNLFSSTANIIFRRTDKELSGLAQGDGPIDAAFKAIENITGHHYELDDFQIQAVTEGREAMGSALIKLRYNGKLYSGNGLSTDIIGSSISAYLNALNKIAYEESHK